MFTGIIRSLGRVVSCETLPGQGQRMVVSVDDGWPVVSLGESVSINGVCSTIESIETGKFSVVYMPETLAKTTIKKWASGLIVNLELPATLHTWLGGHIVSGHVDTIGTVRRIERNADFARVEIAYPEAFAPYLIPKGSITVDGMSLTVGEVSSAYFSVYLIPHTLSNTNWATVVEGQWVNLEFDQIGKYVARQLDLRINQKQ